MKSYEEMLQEGKKNLPEPKSTGERFEIPTAKGHHQGSKTIINNFSQIVSQLRRPQEQIIKYLQRELAVPAILEGQRLILGRKISSDAINKKISQYCKEYFSQIFAQ